MIFCPSVHNNDWAIGPKPKIFSNKTRIDVRTLDAIRFTDDKLSEHFVLNPLLYEGNGEYKLTSCSPSLVLAPKIVLFCASLSVQKPQSPANGLKVA